MSASFLFFATLALLGAVTQAGCPNLCSGHGECNRPDIVCTCFKGWTGGDCSLRQCPLGRAWADEATATDKAHAVVPCSNRGTCDHVTGMCTCMIGFEGLSCDRMSCEADCNGHGVCVSMRYNADLMNLDTSKVPPVTTMPYRLPWDAPKIFGCRCDPSYAGHDCSLRLCPVGDDPMTSGQLNELQLMKCTASAGTFTLEFAGSTSAPISFDSSSTTVRDILKPIVDVSVSFLKGGATVCDKKGSEIVSIEFLQRFGPQPKLAAGGELKASIVIVSGGASLFDGAKNQLSVVGTKENLPCSGRGTCDTLTGVCTCYTSYITSDGNGKSGTRGDCGAASGGITACPGQGLACSGHGVCSNSPQYKCLCAAGWMGGDCAERTCPTGKAWFDTPIAADKAHQVTECSNKGICDRTKGECTCATNYVGGACDRMACPGNTGAGVLCNGHGKCLSMAQLALNSDIHSNGVATSYTYGAIPNDPLHWDYNQAYGCKCDLGYTGYDCSLRSCPFGDDPMTYNQVFEKQVYKCLAGSGTFTLTFRQQTTAPIAFDATAADIESALNLLSNLGKVKVTFSTGAVACGADSTAAGVKFVVEYLTELGDVPPLVVDTSQLTASVGKTPLFYTFDNGASADLALPSVKGTKENFECSNRGICDRTTGLCACFLGYGSSDGNGHVGSRGDCGYVLPVVSSVGV